MRRTLIVELLQVGKLTVEKYAPTAPSDVQNIAVGRFAGYCYDSPSASSATAFANAFVNSGAASVLNPWRTAVHRATTGDVPPADNAADPGLDTDAIIALIDAAITALDIPGIVAAAIAASGAPPMTVSVAISTAQLKTLDTAYVELIAAPGVGQFVQILQVWIDKSGHDHPLEMGADDVTARVNSFGEYAMLFVADDTPALPWNYSTGNYEAVWVANFADLLRLPDNSIVAGVIGGHGLGENQPLWIGFTPGLPGDRYYTPAAFDEFIGPVNDASLNVFIRYAIHSIYQFN